MTNDTQTIRELASAVLECSARKAEAKVLHRRLELYEKFIATESDYEWKNVGEGKVIRGLGSIKPYDVYLATLEAKQSLKEGDKILLREDPWLGLFGEACYTTFHHWEHPWIATNNSSTLYSAISIAEVNGEPVNFLRRSRAAAKLEQYRLDYLLQHRTEGEKT